MEYPKITLFGDSITRRSTDVDNGCWGSMIEYRVGNFFDLDTRGFEGYNTKWGLELMPKLFPKTYLDKVEIFIPFFGHNDSWDAQYPMHVPVADYEINLRKMIKYLTDNGLEKRKIIMITPTWYHHEAFAEYMMSLGMPGIGKSLEDAEKYAEAVLRVASDEGLEVVDFFKISAHKEPLRDMFCDGVHFSRSGAKMLFDQLMPIIEKKIESSYKKPLADLWNAIPFDQHPEMKPVLEAYTQSLKKQ